MRKKDEIMTPCCVIQDWVLALPSMQQQSVLFTAIRGPDGIAKHHPVKEIQMRYRATILKAAHFGRAMEFGDIAPSFMRLDHFTQVIEWNQILDTFFENVDSLPHHYYMHIAHASEIIGYHHPNWVFKDRWGELYRRACLDMHVAMETQKEMDERLNDWDRKYWE